MCVLGLMMFEVSVCLWQIAWVFEVSVCLGKWHACLRLVCVWQMACVFEVSVCVFGK